MKLQIHELKNLTTKTMSKKINFKSSITAMAMLLLLITGLATSCKKTTCNYAPCTVRDSINISTGRDDSGKVDPNWIVTNSPYTPPGRTPVIIKPGDATWQQSTSIVGTNAGWINCTGKPYDNVNNLNGNYTYETSFTITNNTISFSCDFGIAYDDALLSIELVDPSSTVFIPLVDPTHPAATLSQNIGTVITTATGTWKIIVKIKTVITVQVY